MARPPRIPMQPSELPQQRLYRVKGLPARPADWSVTTGPPAEDIAPITMPQSARYIGQVEWAWSPMHMRIDAYYLSMCSHHRFWVLWGKGYDDNWSQWMAPSAEAVSARCGLGSDAAARLLLLAYWRTQREQEVDHFHWVNEGELLSAGALTEIAGAAWGDEDDENDGDGPKQHG
jgi:hypothetical protein